VRRKREMERNLQRKQREEGRRAAAPGQRSAPSLPLKFLTRSMDFIQPKRL